MYRTTPLDSSRLDWTRQEYSAASAPVLTSSNLPPSKPPVPVVAALDQAALTTSLNWRVTAPALSQNISYFSMEYVMATQGGGSVTYDQSKWVAAAPLFLSAHPSLAGSESSVNHQQLHYTYRLNNLVVSQ